MVNKGDKKSRKLDLLSFKTNEEDKTDQSFQETLLERQQFKKKQQKPKEDGPDKSQ